MRAFGAKRRADGRHRGRLQSGSHDGIWLLNAMLQRTADTGAAMHPELLEVAADYRSVWRHGDDVVVVWRLLEPAVALDSTLRDAGLWSLPDDAPNVASSGDASEARAATEGWTAVDD